MHAIVQQANLQACFAFHIGCSEELKQSAVTRSPCLSVPASCAGETGSQVLSAEDAAFYDTLVQYLRAEGVGDDGKHNPIPHVFWWAWNANSGDTGGIVDATWTQVQA